MLRREESAHRSRADLKRTHFRRDSLAPFGNRPGPSDFAPDPWTYLLPPRPPVQGKTSGSRLRIRRTSALTRGPGARPKRARGSTAPEVGTSRGQERAKSPRRPPVARGETHACSEGRRVRTDREPISNARISEGTRLRPSATDRGPPLLLRTPGRTYSRPDHPRKNKPSGSRLRTRNPSVTLFPMDSMPRKFPWHDFKRPGWYLVTLHCAVRGRNVLAEVKTGGGFARTRLGEIARSTSNPAR